jgi:preprotein translocase subunit SecF
MIDFVGRRFTYLLISSIMLIISIIAIATGGLKPGIEFSSGSTLTFVFSSPVTQADMRSELATLGYADATIQDTTRQGVELSGGNLTGDNVGTLDQAVKAKFGPTAVFTYNSDQSGVFSYNVVYAHTVSQSDIEAVVSGAGITGVTTKATITPALLVRTKTINQARSADSNGNAIPSDLDKLQTAINTKFGSFGTFDFYSVSATVATSVVRNAIIAVIVAAIAILLYITFAFRKMPNPLRWGTCAVIALVHDALFVVGTFAILGIALHIEVDAMFISAVLTVVGYSVHDTIVVFDRIRENIRLGVSKDFATTVDYSLNQTLGRSLRTSLTVVFVLLALLLMGGTTIRTFVLTMLIGIIVGTYSSVFVASQLLVVWDKKEWRRFISWMPFVRPTTD